MPINMRPGITSDYSALPAKTPYLGKCVGLAAPVPGTTADMITPHRISNQSQAADAFGPESSMTAYIEAILDNAACDIIALPYPPGNEEGCLQAVKQLASHPDPYCIAVCDANREGLLHIKNLVAGGDVEGEKLFFAACPPDEDEAGLAEAINCERILLAAPAVTRQNADSPNLSGALLAAMVSHQTSPSTNLFGEEVLGDYAITSPLSEERLNELLNRGVTVFETAAVSLETVRCVTTRTKNSEGGKDYSLRNISSTLTIDYVTESIREALQNRLFGGSLTLDAIASITEWELMKQREAGAISSYEKPSVTPSGEDPSCCDVTIGFQIRQGVAQIELHVKFDVSEVTA